VIYILYLCAELCVFAKEPVTPNDPVDDVENVSEHKDPTEPKLEGPTERVQIKDFTNLELTQGKPRCINQCSLSVILNISLCFI
jgi:hypothetical protein